MSKYEQVEPHVGIVRAPLAADLTLTAAGLFGPKTVSLDTNGRCVVGTAGNSGYVGVLVKNVPVIAAGRFTAAVTINNWMGARAADIVDIMIQGQIALSTDISLAAGSAIYGIPGTGVLTATSSGNVRCGFTVEADRLVVDGK